MHSANCPLCGRPPVRPRASDSRVRPEVDALIARLRAEGLSLAQIAARLDAEGVRPSQDGRRRWAISSVAKILARISRAKTGTYEKEHLPLKK